MSARTCTLTASMKVAWWLGPLLAVLVTFARLTGRTPSDATVRRIAKSAVRVRIR